MEKINFIDFPSFRQTVLLDEVNYVLKFDWNSRYNFWALSFYDILFNPIVLGIKIVLNYELINKFNAYDMPQGLMYAVDPNDNFDPIEKDDFINGRVSLIYIPESDV